MTLFPEGIIPGKIKVVIRETELLAVVYDCKASDGTWCELPYPGHQKGCPKFPGCPEARPDFLDLMNQGWTRWSAVIAEFDLKAYAEKRKKDHPRDTERQLRNLLYWQSSVVKQLRDAARRSAARFSSVRERGGFGLFKFGIILDIPEASGVNVFETMARVDVKLDRHPDVVRKVMLVGGKEAAMENKGG